MFVQGANWLALHPNEQAEVYDAERQKCEVGVLSLASKLMQDLYKKKISSFTSSTTIAKTSRQEFLRALCVSKVAWRGTFRLLDPANNGGVSMEQVAQAFAEWSVDLTDFGKQVVSSFTGDDQLIKYKALCDEIYKCDF